jgi:ABC-type lipoprotein export system ATPase subunit
MLHHALNLEMVTLPGDAAAWPAPLSLHVTLNEVVLIEGVKAAAGEPLLDVAATLRRPRAGLVRHWGRDAAALPRDELYDLRRRIAYIAPRTVLLHRLTLGTNIALGPCYHTGCSEAAALKLHGDLLERLQLSAHLHRFPAQVSPAFYYRTLWARELVKDPELILATVDRSQEHEAGVTLLLEVLRDYLTTSRVAGLILGETLDAFYPLGHRLLRLKAGRLRQLPLLEYRERPLSAYLPLV